MHEKKAKQSKEPRWAVTDLSQGVGTIAQEFVGQTDTLQAPLYPAVYSQMTSEDDRIRLKASLVPAHQGPLGSVHLSEKDVAYLQRKEAEQEEFEFEKWFSCLLDFNDPNALKLAQELNPAFFDRREQLLVRMLRVFSILLLKCPNIKT